MMMIKTIIISFIAILCFCGNGKAQQSDNTKKITRINWKPKQVVQYVIYGAKTRNFDGFESLIDPLGESDGDTKAIATIGTKDKKMQDFFSLLWGNAIITGEGKATGTNTFEIPIEFYLPNQIVTEKINLIRRENGAWYIKDF